MLMRRDFIKFLAVIGIACQKKILGIELCRLFQAGTVIATHQGQDRVRQASEIMQFFVNLLGQVFKGREVAQVRGQLGHCATGTRWG